MAIKITFKGIEGLISDIRKYPERVANDIQDEIQDWAKRTTEAAKRDVPKDTRALENSIRYVLGKDKLTWIVKAGGINGVNYAPYVEFGTGALVDKNFLQEFGLVQYAQQFKGKGIREVNLPARSYLYRNARTEFEKTVQNIKQIIRDGWKN